MAIRAIELIPTTPEQLPYSAGLMSEYRRKTDFRVVSSRLLRAMLAINSIEKELAEGWQKLKTGEPVYKDTHKVRLFNAAERVAIFTSVSPNVSPLATSEAVTASIHVFRGDNELEIRQNQGFEYPDHNGELSLFYVRGTVGGEGNPGFSREELDCEPELQRLAISPLGYSGEATEYAFFTRPPVGGRGVIEGTLRVSEFLEAIPTE